MRLQRYILNEIMYGKDIDTLFNVIANKCKPFLKEFGDTYRTASMASNFIYRGMSSKSDTFTVEKALKNRRPRYVDDRLHSFMNDLGKNLFGWNIRTEGVFTGDYSKACNYGAPYIFIPIGKYKYVYNKNTWDIYGLYDDHTVTASHLKVICKKMKTSDDPIHKENADIQLEKLDSIEKEIEHIYKSEYKISGLNNVIRGDNNWEAIFKCNEYIAIRNYHKHDIERIMEAIL